MSGASSGEAMNTVPRRNVAVGVAAAAVLLTAADTYVIVLALPAIMSDVGIGLDRLQEATPIISGFLLGYVAAMPLLGRLSDLRGRRAILLLCLALFAAGSLVTASAHDLSSAVAGRALQGLGGGGMVPVTLALVADLWPAAQRGVPLGVLGGVQETGSVVGPLYGALILSLSTWRTIFWINIPLCALLAVALLLGMPGARTQRRALPVAALVLGGLAIAAGALAVAAPELLVDSETAGVLFLPTLGQAWLTPLVIAAMVLAAAACAFAATRRRHARPNTPSAGGLRSVDWPGALLLAGVLAAIVVSFSTADPSRSAFSPSAPWLLAAGVLCAAAFVVRERTTRDPLLDLPSFRAPGAVGGLLTNLALGAALMTALLDVPILARSTVFPDSQLGAALVLLRLLVGVPVGALAGGWLCSRLGNRAVAAAGLALSAAMLAVMSRWSATTLADPLGPGWLHPSDPVLFACGIGFGLAIAPVNASMLAAVRASLHGIASALVVVARMVGMLAGVSILTAVGLHAFYATTAKLPSPITMCPQTPLDCPAYNTLVTGAIVSELSTVFLGAAICAAIASLFAATLLRDPRPQSLVAHSG